MVLEKVISAKELMLFLMHTKKNSIENSKRLLRGEETGHKLQSITSTQVVKQWRNFLARSSNQTSLITFIVSEWKDTQHRGKLGDYMLPLVQKNEYKYHVYSVTKKRLIHSCCYILLIHRKRLWLSL